MSRPQLPKALLLLAVLSTGCRTQVPSIFLQVEDPSGIQPTQLRVTIRVQGMDTTTVVRPENPGAPLQSPQTMRLILPDDTAGHTAQLTVEGLEGGEVTGMALVSAAVVLGAETQVTVALVPQTSCPGGICACNITTCPSGCCQGDTCTTPNATACGAGGDACVVCAADKADRCTDGACRCGAEAPCGNGYTCEAGACVPTNVPACTRAEDCVTPPGQCFESQGTCGGDGVCTYAAKGAGTTCNDGNSCTDADSCDGSGTCAGSARVCDTPTSACQEATGACVGGNCSYAQLPENAPCDDGDACTTGDVCSGTGVCGGTALGCNSPPSQCHVAAGSCANGVCSYTLKNPGSACDDGNACTTGDACNASGVCAGSALTCSSPPNGCYQEAGTCSGGTCQYAPKNSGAACNDGSACTTVDTCNGSGTCVGSSPVSCASPPSQCHQNTGTCDPSNGTCSYAFKSSGSSCNDSNACTTVDACNGSGTCVGSSPVSCASPPSQCHQNTGTCNTSNGTCSYAFKSSGSSCNDSNACTAVDTCNGSGTCVGSSPVSCSSPPSQCHQNTGTCNTSNGSCSYSLKSPGSACNDGNACTTSDSCSASGVCSGTTVTCDSPPNECYQATGTCSGGSCNYAPKGAGIACNDGNPCTANDACNGAGACVGSAAAANGDACMGTDCGRCSAGACVQGCTAFQQCCWGYSCQPSNQQCGIEP